MSGFATRRRSLAVLLALLLGASAVAVVRARTAPEVVGPNGEAGAEARAAQACRALQEAADLIERNASVSAVLAAVDRAVRQSREASAAQARWIALAGGAESLAIALRADDPRAASVGIRVVTAECARTAAPLR